MSTFTSPSRHRVIALSGLVLVLAGLLSGCSGRGGGWLPPDNVVFTDQASFGFSFSCERSSNAFNLHPKSTRLHIELSYTEHGAYAGVNAIPAGRPFSIHGVVDSIDPALESMVCTGDDSAVDTGQLVFLGRFRVTSGGSGEIVSCQVDNPGCRFEVIVQDNDGSTAPSSGDDFSIALSGTSGVSTVLDGPLLYFRGGKLGGGNLMVD
jgi:hypothetical protein